MLAPSPPRRPARTLQLGRERVDDYAWMKDDNWQAVLRDPEELRADIRDAPGGRERLHRGHAGRHRGAAGADVRGDEGAHQGGRHLRPARRRRRGTTTSATRPARSIPLHAAPAARRADRRDGAAGRGRPKGRPCFQRWATPATAPDHALYAWAADEQGSEYYTHPGEGPGDRRAAGRRADESATGDFAFSPDSRWLFWIWRDENARPAKVFRRPAAGRRGRAGL